MLDINDSLSQELKLPRKQIDGAVALLKDEASVPFIARYRKEVTGGLDEVQITAIKDRLKYLSELEERRALVIKTITEAGKMTPELEAAIKNATAKAELEDIYMPFRARRRTRSTAARQKGLEPLADLIWKQELASGSVEELVKPFISEEKGVKDMAEALAGARDIVAERIAEDAPCRKIARDLLIEEGKVVTKAREGVELAKGKFANYAQFSEPLKTIPAHRILAVMRGSSEKQLSLVLDAPREKILEQIRARVIKNPDAILKPDLVLSIEESYDRLLGPSMDNELRQELKHRADLEAIEVFAKNLRALLLQAPLGEKPVLAIDPGLRTGCKIAVLDATGKLLEHTVVYPDKSDEERSTAGVALAKLIKDHGIKAVAIGNGTGGREADTFVREVMKATGVSDCIRVVVNESGASIYSASPVAREEFPDLDITVRGTVSIGRRLQDPLSELVKLDPKSIGVGQYQHDVDQTLLKQKLDEVVESCVNHVGVDVNTASAPLLRYVAGIGPKLAKNVIDLRNVKGGFKSREDLHEISGLGPKLFEQCAGFLRVRNSPNPLDNSAVHPESYGVVEKFATAAGCAVKDLIGNADALTKLDLNQFKDEKTGEYTLKDIVEELKKPGRDPRDVFVNPEFNESVHDVKDLQEGMVLNGVVTNLTAFGAFVDVGVHQDGLVHISAITHKFIRDPSEAVALGQHVKVKVLSVDAERKRISLSIKALQEPPVRQPRPPRPTPAQRPPRPPCQPRAAAAGTPPAEGAAAGATPAAASAQSGPGSRPPRQRFQDRRPRPQRPAPAGAAAPSGSAPSSTPSTPSAPSGERRSFTPRKHDDRGGREGPRDRRPPSKPEPGKPDYSKFFVKGKRKEKEKRTVRSDGASRDEVREVMRKQESSGTTLADLLKKAGVTTDDTEK